MGKEKEEKEEKALNDWIYYILVFGAEVLILIAVNKVISICNDIKLKFTMLDKRILQINDQNKTIVQNNTRAVDKLDGHLDQLTNNQYQTAQILSELKGTINAGVADIKTEIAKK